MVLSSLWKIKQSRNRIPKCPFLPNQSLFLFLFSIFLLLNAGSTVSAQNSLLDKRLSIPKQQTSIYEALIMIGEKSDCLFVYDSKVVQSNKKVMLEAENDKVKSILDRLLNDKSLAYKIVGHHILIYRQEVPQVELSNDLISPRNEQPAQKQIVLKGCIFDNENKSPIPYATIGIIEKNIGTITNADGFFILKLPDTLALSMLQISHMGYVSKLVPVGLLIGQKTDLFLNRRVISMQEVVIRYMDPLVILSKALANREINNSLNPVYMNAFYREGVQKNSRFVSYSEGVFKIYKSTFLQSENADQVKVLKSRKIVNSNPKDTVFVKLKAGIQSALMLDIVKNCPDFLDIEQQSDFIFTFSDIVPYNTREAYAISFKQKPTIEDPLFTGTVYVDIENFAILGADFEINPATIDKAADDLIFKKSRKLSVKFLKISYSVKYSLFNNTYYLSHARCEMNIKTRIRNHFTTDVFKTFLELATYSIDTLNVEKMLKQEILKPEIVFSDINNNYDELFWGEYNFIFPEEKITDAISRIIGKLEETESNE